MLKLNPFTKIVWNTNSIRMQWANKLNMMRDLSFETEYQMVKHGLREAHIIQIGPQNYEEQTKKIIDDKLTFLPISTETFCNKQVSLRRLTHSGKTRYGIFCYFT